MALKIAKTTNTGNFFADTYRVKNGNPENRGNEYRIDGLYSFLCSTDSPVGEVSKSVLEDLEHYRRYKEERKKIWKSRGSRESKLEASHVLRDEVIASRLSNASERL